LPDAVEGSYHPHNTLVLDWLTECLARNPTHPLSLDYLRGHVKTCTSHVRCGPDRPDDERVRVAAVSALWTLVSDAKTERSLAWTQAMEDFAAVFSDSEQKSAATMTLLDEALAFVECTYPRHSVERALVDATVGRLHFLGRRWLAAVGHLRCSLAPLLSMPPRARSMSNLVAVCHAAICGMGTLHMLQAHDECAVLQKRIRRCVVEWLHEHRSADPNAAVACFIWSRRLRHSCEIVEWLERYRRSSADRAETAALLHEFRDHEAYVRSELALETTNPLNHSMYDAVRAMCERF